MIFAFIKDELAADYPVGVACDVLGVSRSGYYAWSRRPASGRATRRAELSAEVARVFDESRGVYGSPRVCRALAAAGVAVSENTVADLMRERALRARARRPYTPRTTDGDHGRPVAENLLDRQFDAALPNRKWVADITYVPTGEGWLYVAAVLDLCSRRVVGWSMADHMRADLVADALRMAVARRRPAAGLLHHSDRGSQYASDEYRHLLAERGMAVSMSGRGDCWDNAAMESFWATLKVECVHHEHYATREQARASVFEYVEVFYNRQRLHSSLGYVSPEQFEASLN